MPDELQKLDGNDLSIRLHREIRAYQIHSGLKRKRKPDPIPPQTFPREKPFWLDALRLYQLKIESNEYIRAQKLLLLEKNVKAASKRKRRKKSYRELQLEYRTKCLEPRESEGKRVNGYDEAEK